MSKYAIRRGHQRTGNDGCAEDILNEIDVVNAYYQYIIEGLKSLGHEVLDVTPPEANRSLSNSLMYGVNMANNWGAECFISCHANSCDRTDNPVGCEVVYLGSSIKSKVLAESVDSVIAGLGFKDRGAKADVRGLCELRNTNMPCIIVEPFFISSQADVDLWNSIGGKGLGYAIVSGLTGQTINTFGWIKNETGWWYKNQDGSFPKDSWQLINGEWYSFDAQGYARQSKWIQDKGYWYWLQDNCAMAKNKWLWIDGEAYFFGDKGGMYSNCTTPDGYFVDNTGAWDETITRKI